MVAGTRTVLVLPAAGCAVKDKGWVAPRPLGKDVPAYRPALQPPKAGAEPAAALPADAAAPGAGGGADATKPAVKRVRKAPTPASGA